MIRPSRITFALTLSLLGLTLTPLLAQTTLYATGFENPPFANGSQLTGQDGWVAPGFASPNAALISTSAAHTGQQGLMVRGADLVDDPALPFFAAGSYRHPVNYLANGGVTLVSADVFVSGPQSATGLTAPFFGATVASRLLGPNGGDTYEFQLSSEGVYYGFDDNLSNSVGDPGVLAPIHADVNRWVNMAIASDFSAKTVTFLLDGTALGTIPFSDPDFDTLLRGALVTYASPDAVGFSRSDYAAKFDSFSITAVPEPSAVAVFLSMAIPGGLFLRRRRSRK